jgi:hypothetical protein
MSGASDPTVSPGQPPTPATAPPFTSLQAPTPAALPLDPGAVFGAYRIDGRLGEGGMGIVYRATHTTLGRPAALKVMRAELSSDRGFAERFLREARTAAALSHPQVVTIHDAGECDGQLFMAFELVEGGDLAGLLDRRGPLPWREALQLIDRCAAGVEAIAAAGLVHRDLKPTNIFLDAQGRPKLGDFGLARTTAGDDRMTHTGVGMGTPSYMSPEQAHGLTDIDVRSDLHALGGTLFTLLTGKPPYEGATAWVVVNKVCSEPPPDPRLHAPQVPPGVAAFIAQAMAKERVERFPDAAAFRAALQALVSGSADVATVPYALPSPTMPALPPSRLERELGRLARWWHILTALIVVALVCAPLVLAAPLGLRRAEPWPYDLPGFWGLVLLILALASVLLWLPLRLLAAVRHAGAVRPVGRRDVDASAVAGALVAGAAAWLGVGAVFELFRWQGDAWLVVQGVIGLSATCAWLRWLAHPLRSDPVAFAVRHLQRLLAVTVVVAGVGWSCFHLTQARETPPPAPVPVVTAVRKEAVNVFSRVREVFKPAPAPAATPAEPSGAEESVPDTAFLLARPAANAVAFGLVLLLIVLVPTALALVARRQRALASSSLQRA